MKTSGKAQNAVIALSYERKVCFNEWGTTQLTKMHPHSPYSTTKASVKFSLHPFIHLIHLLFERKKNFLCCKEKTGGVCCKKWICCIYWLQVPDIFGRIRLIGSGETSDTMVRGSNRRCSLYEPILLLLYFALNLCGGFLTRLFVAVSTTFSITFSITFFLVFVGLSVALRSIHFISSVVSVVIHRLRISVRMLR